MRKLKTEGHAIMVKDKNIGTETYLNDKEVAVMFSISVNTLRDWRHRRLGPTYIKMGRHVRYTLTDIEAFVASRTIHL